MEPRESRSAAGAEAFLSGTWPTPPLSGLQAGTMSFLKDNVLPGRRSALEYKRSETNTYVPRPSRTSELVSLAGTRRSAFMPRAVPSKSALVVGVCTGSRPGKVFREEQFQGCTGLSHFGLSAVPPARSEEL